jgi:replicative DNA helicase
MQGSSKKGSENRQQEISEISRSLKGLAREIGVPVIALSQLSRSVESRQVKKPMLSDLRESGSLEQDADIVAFLYRDDYYNPDSDQKNITEVIIAKHRNGPVDTVQLFFHKQFTKFSDLSKVQG